MPLTCTAAALAVSAVDFEKYSRAEHLAVQTYLISVAAGGSTDPQVLLTAAKDFLKLDQVSQLAIQNYLLCSLVP